MALTINHAYVATGTDAGTGEVHKAEWNAPLNYNGTLDITNGGTGASSSPAALTNLTGYTSTATAAGTTALTNSSSFYQVFTGATTQTITLPATSTLALGWSFHICNNSSGNLTLNTSTGVNVATILPGTTVMATCIDTTVNTAAAWESGFTDFSAATGTGSVVLGTSATLTTPTITTPTITYSSAGAVTAGTNAQGQGALTNDHNVVTTAANNPSGVTLPTATTGRRVTVVNRGANPINVYPASGGTINALAANAAFTVGVASAMTFIATSTTQWYTNDVQGGRVLISGPTSVGTGTTFAMTSLPTIYRRLILVCTDLSHNGATTQQFTLSLSDNNGSTYGFGPANIIYAVSLNDTMSWETEINNTDRVGGKTVGNPGVGLIFANTGVVGAVNAIRLGLSSTASFDGGTVSLYGELL